jgi:hypothetical protein
VDCTHPDYWNQQDCGSLPRALDRRHNHRADGSLRIILLDNRLPPCPDTIQLPSGPKAANIREPVCNKEVDGSPNTLLGLDVIDLSEHLEHDSRLAMDRVEPPGSVHRRAGDHLQSLCDITRTGCRHRPKALDNLVTPIDGDP